MENEFDVTIVLSSKLISMKTLRSIVNSVDEEENYSMLDKNSARVDEMDVDSTEEEIVKMIHG